MTGFHVRSPFDVTIVRPGLSFRREIIVADIVFTVVIVACFRIEWYAINGGTNVGIRSGAKVINKPNVSGD